MSARATINEDMKLAAAHAIARVIPDDELHADYIIPSVFNRKSPRRSPRPSPTPRSPAASPAAPRVRPRTPCTEIAMTDSNGPAHPSLAFWFYRHAEIPSHRGDLPATSAGLMHAEAVGAALAASCPAGARVEFLHAPTVRTVQTAEALRRGVRSGLGAGRDVQLGAPRVEQAIRNPDLYVAGYRVEMVSALDAVAAQLPDDALTHDELERHTFFSRFLTAPDRVGLWVADDARPASAATTSRVGSPRGREACSTPPGSTPAASCASRTPARCARSCATTSWTTIPASPSTSSPSS